MKKFTTTFALLLTLLGLPCTGVAQVQATNQVKQQEQEQEAAAINDGIQAMMLTSKAFRAASAKVQPWLVTIESFGGVSAVQGKIGGIRSQGEGNTTGIMISEDGYILTSTFNFVQQPPIITVITGDGKRHIADILGRDNTRKICLLKLRGEVSGMPVPEIVDPEDLVVGQWAISIGVGFGDTNPAISMGIISATNRIAGRAVQTDANISPANYGGPLIDIEGRLIGMCSPMNPSSQAVASGVEWYDSGIGFAVPIHGLEDMIQRLKDGETISPAFLGVQTGPNPKGKGLLIVGVVEGSAAEEAGIKENDVIMAINDKKIKDLMQLQQTLSRFEAGEEIKLTLLKDKKIKNMHVTLGSFAAPKTEGPQIEPPKIR